jgi:hypothetical protein
MSIPRAPGGPSEEVKKVTVEVTDEELKLLMEMISEHREEKRQREIKEVQRKAREEADHRERVAELKTYPKWVEEGGCYPTLRMSGISIRGRYPSYCIYRSKMGANADDHVWSSSKVEPVPSEMVASVLNAHLSKLLKDIS